MIPTGKRRLALVCCVLLVAGAGCLSAPGESLEETVREEFDEATPPEGVTATHNYTYDDGTDTVSWTANVWLRADGLERTEFDSTPGTDGGSILITYDGEEVWYYFPEQDLAEVYQAEGDPNALEVTYETYERLVSDLKVVEANEETVGDHETYHLVLEPREENDVPLDVITDALFPVEAEDEGNLTAEDWETPPDRIEVWLDQEHLFPVRSTFDSPDGVRTVEYHNLTFDAGLSDEMFEFDPPEGTDVQVLDVSNVTQYEAVAGADNATPFTVAEPGTVPDGYDFQLATVATYETRDQRVATVWYENGAGSRLLVQRTNGPIYLEVDDETVTVNGREGSFEVQEENGVHLLNWSCGGVENVIATDRTVDREQMIAVAESFPC